MTILAPTLLEGSFRDIIYQFTPAKNVVTGQVFPIVGGLTLGVGYGNIGGVQLHRARAGVRFECEQGSVKVCAGS